ncbi:MAG: cytochrome C [Propionibacteriales bacterium]|nr:cytochrome C [Propionibacteriales bacterium]
MRFLSTRRRHPLAGLVVLLLGLVLTGSAYAVAAPGPSADPLAQDGELVEQGRKLFLVGCSSCHGKNGEGVMTQSGGMNGPSLVGVGSAAVEFQVATGRMPITQGAEQAPRKDRVFDANETLALSAFVASLGPGPAIPDESEYDPAGLTEEEIVQGGEIWRTNCTACHNFNASGGALPNGKNAPSLAGVEPLHMYEAMLTGPQQMPSFSGLTPEEKRMVIGYVKSLEESPSYGGSSLGSLGPVSEGLFAWLIGIGALVCVAVWIGASGARVKK